MFAIRYVSCGTEYECKIRFSTREEAETEAVYIRWHGYVSSVVVFQVTH